MAVGHHTQTSRRRPARRWPPWLRWVLIPATVIAGIYAIATLAISTARTEQCSYDGVRTVCVTTDKGHPVIEVVGVVVIVLAVAWVIRQIVRRTRPRVGL